LVVKVRVDMSDVAGKLALASAEINGFGDEAQSSGRRSSNAFRDTERGLGDLERASKDVRFSLNGGPLGLLGAIGEVAGGVLKLGSMVENGASSFGTWLQEVDQGATVLTGFGAALAESAPALGTATAGLIAFGGALLVLPALVGAVMFAVQFLADVLSTLAAVAYAALGPLGTLALLLGGLGLGFVLAGERALKGKGQFSAFGKEVDGVKKQFSNLVAVLAGDLLPDFQRLAHAASIALSYLTKLAHMPLAEAFHSLATKGVGMITHFLDQVGQVLARPIRLAIKIAFGTGSAQADIQGLLHTLGGFLFGKTITMPVSAQQAHGAQTPQSIFKPGALNPIQKWFDSHDFTKTGIRWGNEIVNGFLASGGAKRIGKWLDADFTDAGHRAGKSFMAALAWELGDAIPHLLVWLYGLFSKGLSAMSKLIITIIGAAWNGVKSAASAAWKWVSSNASAEFDHIKGNLSSMWSSAIAHIKGDWHSFTGWLGSSLSSAWNAISSKAQSIWNHIISFIERPLHISIDWPSPPAWLSHLVGGITGGPGGSAGATARTGRGHAAGGIFTRPTVARIGESGAEAVIPLTGPNGRAWMGGIGGGGTHIHISLDGATFLSGGRPAAREMARILKPELDRIVTAR
jgi:hypothetical protein